MKVVAFVGPSGTGKSYRAMWVAKERDIDFIIDDGLLIGHSKVIAGYSAKREPNKMAATKRACFYDKKHAEEVKMAIENNNPSAILIIGTSDNMVDVIRKALELDEISETVYIQDVATSEEIKKAVYSRKIEGKHVIPVPTFELKKTFSGYFMDRIKIFKKKDKVEYVAEKTIVRPTYSYFGRYIISDKVIAQIAEYIACKQFDVVKTSFVDGWIKDGDVFITLSIIVKYKDLNQQLFLDIQEAIKSEVERLTCMNVEKVNIVVKSVEV